jgi:hypothetical protein
VCSGSCCPGCATARASGGVRSYTGVMWVRLFLAVLAQALVFGCGGQTAADSTNGAIAAKHRSTGTMCPSERGPGNGLGALVDECTQDSDCTAGTNGRCLNYHRTVCSYDDCFSDSDCRGVEPCQCRPSATSMFPNYCVIGSNCRLDSDCGPNGFCSPSMSDCMGTPSGYFCHTPQDTCVNDSDCSNPQTCEYDKQSYHWSCVEVSKCY